jgi:SAM-dependent methyltransferase
MGGSGVAIARSMWRQLPVSFRARVWDVWSRVIPYQRLSYQGKTLAWGTDRTAAYRLLFPDPPTGKTILDVGCHVGFYCFQAASEGAAYCLGVDINGRRIAKARRIAARHRIPNVEFAESNIAQFAIGRRFDVVLCLNVLQHMKTVAEVDLVLARLEEAANDCVLLVVPITGRSGVAYEREVRGTVPYLLLSRDYFARRYADSFQFTPLPTSCYGPNRAIVRIAIHA